MASPVFKRWQARIVPLCLERSAFVFVSSLTLIVLMVFWQPIGSIVWSVSSIAGRIFVNGAYFGGWVMVIWSTFLIDHFSYFGLRQAYNGYCGRTCKLSEFRTPGAYRIVRHPIHTGWLVILWATPTMTVTRLVLAIGLSIYVVMGTRLEERGLVRRFDAYAQYIRKVPMLLPSLRRRLVVSDDN